MSAPMEHPIWSEDEIEMRDVYLDERPSHAPGAVAIHWHGPAGKHELLIAGNDADDLMERYRAAGDSKDRTHILRNEITRAIAS